MEDIFGTLAATLTTLSFLPQAIKVIKTQHTKDLSMLMYLAFSLGVTCWLIYGIMLSSWPMIVANIVTLPLTLIILFLKLKNG